MGPSRNLTFLVKRSCSPTLGPSRIGRKQSSISFISPSDDSKLDDAFDLWLSARASKSPSEIDLVRIDAVNSHQTVLKSLRTRQILHAGARGRARLTVFESITLVASRLSRYKMHTKYTYTHLPSWTKPRNRQCCSW